MKPPVTHDQLFEMWATDAVINQLAPDEEMRKIPSLHAKYLNIQVHHSLKAKKLNSEYLKKRKFKHEYYNGELNNPDDLRTYDLQPMSKQLKNKSDEAFYLESDDELNDLLLKKMYHEEIEKACISIIWELKNRTSQIKSIMDWERYISGK